MKDQYIQGLSHLSPYVRQSLVAVAQFLYNDGDFLIKDFIMMKKGHILPL
jgi:hypothetical protein